MLWHWRSRDACRSASGPSLTPIRCYVTSPEQPCHSLARNWHSPQPSSAARASERAAVRAEYRIARTGERRSAIASSSGPPGPPAAVLSERSGESRASRRPCRWSRAEKLTARSVLISPLCSDSPLTMSDKLKAQIDRLTAANARLTTGGGGGGGFLAGYYQKHIRTGRYVPWTKLLCTIIIPSLPRGFPPRITCSLPPLTLTLPNAPQPLASRFLLHPFAPHTRASWHRHRHLLMPSQLQACGAHDGFAGCHWIRGRVLRALPAARPWRREALGSLIMHDHTDGS